MLPGAQRRQHHPQHQRGTPQLRRLPGTRETASARVVQRPGERGPHRPRVQDRASQVRPEVDTGEHHLGRRAERPVGRGERDERRVRGDHVGIHAVQPGQLAALQQDPVVVLGGRQVGVGEWPC